MPEHLVEFERIGRTHNPAPLTVTAETADEVAEAVYQYARRMLHSCDVEVVVNLDESCGLILCGFQVGGRFTIRKRPGAAAQLAVDELDAPSQAAGRTPTSVVLAEMTGGDQRGC